MKENNTQRNIINSLISDDLLVQCMHCGLCLPTCPTYNVDHLESSSPRGRIRLIKNVSEGKLEINDTYLNEVSFCLDCQACETACPAGVKYGAIIEAAREDVSQRQLEPIKTRFLRRFGLNFIIGNHTVLKITAKFLYFYQNYGIRNFLRRIGFFKILGKSLGEADSLSPQISKRFSSDTMDEIYNPSGEIRYRVIMPLGCIMDVAYADIHSDTLNVLLQHGCQVIIPRNQGCCGSLHAHNGEGKKGRKLAQETYDLFSKYNYDYIVSNSAGCGAYMKEYGHVIPGDIIEQRPEKTPDTSEKEGAQKFASKVMDISEFLAKTGFFAENYEYNGKVTYHDACHLVHTQKIFKEPREIIKQIKGVQYTELNEASWCCGSAGIYNVARYDDSLKFLTRKMDNIAQTESEVVVMGNPGCMGQISHGTDKFNVNTEVVHFATFLNRAWKPKNNRKEHTAVI